MFEKILIANRGEIALRIHRACREMGIDTVVVHSTADSNSMPVRMAGESVCIGGPKSSDSYLNIASILTAASLTNADAIHPGIGFLSENAQFSKMVEEHGFTFIGPSADIISKMGDKAVAKDTVKKLGLPVIEGSKGIVPTVEEGRKLAEDIGFPVLIKAVAGGGGKGMKVAKTADEFESSFNMARNEAKAAFGNGDVYIEKFLGNPRHIEVQVIGDSHGNAIHLGERDCSIQRRHQKVIEEAGSPALNQEERDFICNLAADTTRKMGYCGAGTFEFLYEDGKFYFLEMNTRLQVEHPITEMITGVDLVREQIRVASGAPLSVKQEDVKFNGHAIECRINAEDSETFFPSPGKITQYHAPGGLGVRVDSAIYTGYVIPPHYDSMVAKLIVHGSSRTSCLMRLRRTLDEFVVDGIKTTIPLHEHIISQPEFVNGDYTIHWLEKHLEEREK
ncbi:MAG: acetyl-CoA carboxylase biotin carboxylase subunit [Rickettsiales bacterium]|nr:acetyl-CoA carboxylase biotin carboxylase subunit [Rickettsiales bacterium]|tara:strand:- start:9424 stop:10770 length:1347 start_codon:yes stop_codon:yes gene_type:complete